MDGQLPDTLNGWPLKTSHVTRRPSATVLARIASVFLSCSFLPQASRLNLAASSGLAVPLPALLRSSQMSVLINLYPCKRICVPTPACHAVTLPYGAVSVTLGWPCWPHTRTSLTTTSSTPSPTPHPPPPRTASSSSIPCTMTLGSWGATTRTPSLYPEASAG